MKTLFTIALCGFGLMVSAQSQETTYQPNARQAVQKSRMQQPQYYEVTRDVISSDQEDLEAIPAPKTVNYQAERPVAIDAPKRRGNKPAQSSFAKLASYREK